VAAVVKPQLGAVFVAYEIWRGRWSAVAGAALAGALLTALGVARMTWAHVAWWPAWISNLRAFAVGGDADPTSLGDVAFMILNLDSTLRALVQSRAALYAITWSVLAALGTAFAWADARREGGPSGRTPELVSLSMVSVATLLAAYHRYYDVTVLIFPVALAVRLMASRDQRERRLGWITLLLVAPLLVPAPAALHQLQLSGRLPANMTSGLSWRLLALGVHTWGLLALACWLLFLRLRSEPVRDAPGGVAAQA
jgi:hypothetical protein